MRITSFIISLLLLTSPLFAAISTTINNIDNNFDNPQALYPVDLDQDGDIDIVGIATNADNTVDIAWWANNGSETFTEYAIDTTFNGAAALTIADIDQDGDMDVLAASDTGNEIAWWQNDGTPATGAWTKRSIDNAFAGANSIFVIDLDRDGNLDVLSTAGGATDDICWWENDGTPATVTATDWTKYTIDNNFDGANSVFAIDMDKDGDPDVLATANTADDVAWWQNDGTPATVTATDWANKYTIDNDFDGANSIYAVDMDKDGDIDVLAAADQGDDVSWWVNDGTPAGDTWTEWVIDGAFDEAASIYIADLDFDGDLDVAAAAHTADDVSWWVNDGTPANNTWTEHAIKTDFDGAGFVYVTDLDQDGDMDVLATADTDDDLSWWKNTANLESGNIGFTAELKLNDYFNGASSVSAGDIDRDGNIDIAATAIFADDLIWWESDSTPSDGGWIERVIESNFDGATDNAIVDLDRDGDLDIVAIAQNADELAWWQNNGSQAFTKISIATGLNGANSVFATDLDTDGNLDLIATVGLDDDLIWWENDGTPGDGGWTKTTIDADLNGAKDVFAIDLDTDGDMDILACANIDNDVAWWENDGSEGFTKRKIDDNFNGAESVKAADIDIDGDMDVVACAYNGSTITWWANDGSPTDGGWQKYTIDGNANGASDIAIIDIDQDGDLDIVGSLKLGDDITWWESDGSPADGWTEHIVDSNFDGAASIFALDLDRDGDIDLIGASESGDDISWWPNGGAAAVITPSAGDAATPSISVDFSTLSVSTSESVPGSAVSELGIDEPAEAKEEVQEVDVRCFIATAAYGTPLTEEIERLCEFRDRYLLTTTPGKALVWLYYRVSPPLAKVISANPLIKCATRRFLRFLLNIVIVPNACASEEFTVGTITLSPPEQYVVVEEIKTKKQRLYSKADFEKKLEKEKQEFKLLQEILINTIEYRYKPISGKQKFISKDFELVELNQQKAILKKDYIEPAAAKEDVPEDTEEVPVIEAPEEKLVEEKPKTRPSAKRLVASLFLKIETKKTADKEWEVMLPTVLEATANFGEVLTLVTKKITDLIDPEKQAELHFKSSISKGVLGPDGLLIKSLNSRLRENFGLKDGDIIKSVNGKSLTTIHGIASLFSTYTGAPQSATIKILRDEDELTHTYYIK